MTEGIRKLCNSVFICEVMAIAAVSAAKLVDYSPASPRQNAPAIKQAVTGLPTAVKQAARSTGSPSIQFVANYGKLPLGFEANAGQTDRLVKFLSRGRGYALFLTGNEAVLTLDKASPSANRKSQSENIKAGVTPTFR